MRSFAEIIGYKTDTVPDLEDSGKIRRGHLACSDFPVATLYTAPRGRSIRIKREAIAVLEYRNGPLHSYHGPAHRCQAQRVSPEAFLRQLHDVLRKGPAGGGCEGRKVE